MCWGQIVCNYSMLVTNLSMPCWWCRVKLHGTRNLAAAHFKYFTINYCSSLESIVILVVSPLASYSLKGDLQLLLCIVYILFSTLSYIIVSDPPLQSAHFSFKIFLKDISGMKNHVICDWLKITRGNPVMYHWIFSCTQAVWFIHNKVYIYMEVNRNRPHIHDAFNWLYIIG